jgi:hypothetical protein
MKRIGLSFSSCVAAVADGKVSYEDVLAIFASTKAASEKDWEEVLAHYADGYPEEHDKPGATKFAFWQNEEAIPAVGIFPGRPEDNTRRERCLDIARRFLQEGKVYQPRLEGNTHPRNLFSHDGIWIKCDDLDVFKKMYAQALADADKQESLGR